MKKKRTKILCTIGPASSSVSVLSRMIDAGMDIARLNFSHGTKADHKKLIKNIRAASRKVGERVAVLQDLQGPKIRVGDLPEKGIMLRAGQEVRFTVAKVEYKADGPIHISYDKLHKDVKKGDRLLINDGLIETECIGVRGKEIKVKVKTGGLLLAHKGCNLPDTDLSIGAFTEKDRDDLLFGLEEGVDWVALSFVSSADEIEAVKRIIAAKCRSLRRLPVKIMAKIERRQAVDNFVEILNAADGIMLARGDLGVEIPFEEVPIVQKELVEVCRQAGKPVVVATQMMDSMTENRRATRAEVSDVSNAIIDHTDAVLLAQETAIGDYPVVAVQSTAAIIKETEDSRLDDITFLQFYDLDDIETSLAQSLHVMAENNQIDLIVTAQGYGDIARKINVFRPNAPIVVACKDELAARQMLMRAGVWPIVLDDAPGSFIHRVQRYLVREKILKKQQRAAYIIATPSGEIQLTIR